MEDERKQQHEQLVEMKANLTEALDQQYKAIQDYESIKQELFKNKKFKLIKESEVSGLQKERKALQAEIATVKDELEIRKVEVSVSSWNECAIIDTL